MPGNKGLVPKQTILTEDESPTTFNIWQDTMNFTIVLDDRFARFADETDLGKWKPTSVPNRGFVNDPATVAEANRLTATQKSAYLKILLGSVSAYAPVISNQWITELACSLNEVYDKLRGHYHFRKTGARILELPEFTLGQNETRETLWERMVAFIQDNLLSKSADILHMGVEVTVDEELTPTVLNMLVALWLKTIHKDLPSAVKQRFSTQLRCNTLFTMRDEISDSLSSILQEMQERDAVTSQSLQISRSSFQPRNTLPYRGTYRGGRRTNVSGRKPLRCCLCEAAGRPEANSHFLSKCPYLPADDRQYISKTREVFAELSLEDGDYNYMYPAVAEPSEAHSSHIAAQVDAVTRRVDIIPSPVLEVEINRQPAYCTIDSGAETNLIREEYCKRNGVIIHHTTQRAFMADGETPLPVTGEVHFTCVRDHHIFSFNGLVVRNLNCTILAGMPFLEKNDVFIRPKLRTIYLADCCAVKYENRRAIANSSNTRTAVILRVPHQVCLLPGEDISVKLPSDLQCKEVAVEPRVISPSFASVPDWLQCQIMSPDADGNISLTNSSNEPLLLKKYEQFCQVRPVTDAPVSSTPTAPTKILPTNKPTSPFSAMVSIDPSKFLSTTERSQFESINQMYDEVFSSSLGCYNGASGPFSHIINMGPSLPPQRRGRVPLYNRSNLELLQDKFDALLKEGVFSKPEDLGLSIEYVNPSFLIKKSSGGHRLVTAFNEIGMYAKPQPSIMPNVDETLRQIAQWKFIIKADLSQAYYQIPISKNSLKYVGVVTPFRGVLVYRRAVMGLPGSESSLECLLSRILGDLIVEGSVVKLADDLYCGADTIEKLLATWQSTLHKLNTNGLKLSPTKTVVCPTSTVILGWLWKKGTIQATPHRLNALMSCTPPETITKLRSFIGAYKFLCRVIPKYSEKLNPLDKLCGNNKTPSQKINWTDDLLQSFDDAKAQLKSTKIITLPRREDHLQIITDAAASTSGIASALYVIRDNHPYLAGLFSAKRKGSQIDWLPCEIEALSITIGVKHFGPYLIQSLHKTKVLTDSKPCVEAYKKLSRGEFSSSPRVMTFLSTVSHYQVEIQHIPGRINQFSDYNSRNPAACSGNCQICNYIEKTEHSVVRSLSVADVLSGNCPVPYATRTAWFQIQRGCHDLSKCHNYLKNGITPSKNKKGLRDVKRYLGVASLSTAPADELIIVKQDVPLRSSRQLIVIPRNVIDGLLTALHLKLSHPSKHQLKEVFSRAFYALDVDRVAERVTSGCHMCASLKKVPTMFKQQSSSIPPDLIGRSYSADVIKRELQLILVLRENVSSLTDATFIQNEKTESLKGGLTKLLSKLRPPSSPPISVRVDPGTGFQAMSKDPELSSQGVHIEVGNAKNVNKNPIAEKAISELHGEISRLQPAGGALTDVTLALAIGNLNSRVRKKGLAAIEIWTQRDMNTGEQIPLSDRELVIHKYKQRCENHQPSALYKSRGKTYSVPPVVSVGDLVYLYQDRDKTRARDKYLVTHVQGSKISIQKFTGSQLRAKEYAVEITDIIKVEPHQFPPYTLSQAEESSDEDEEVNEDQKSGGTVETVESDEFSHTDTPSQSESESISTTPEAEVVKEKKPTKAKVRPKRNRKKPDRFGDFATGDADNESSDESLEQPQQNQTGRPKRKAKFKNYVSSGTIHVISFSQ